MFLVKKILQLINILTAFLLLLTYLPYHFDLSFFPKLTLFSYAYPFVLLINAVFVLFWLFFGPRRRILISAIVIIIHFSFIFRLVNYSSSEEKAKEDVSILTYNVHDFSHKAEGENAQLKIKENTDSIIAFIHRENPDIICLQDYSANTKDKKGFHYRLTEILKYRYFYFYKKGSRENIKDCAIYSKYYIADASTIWEESERNYSLIYADIVCRDKKIRVYNFHLISYMLGHDEQNTYSEILHGKINEREGGKNIVRKLIAADTLKKTQTENLIPKLEETSVPYIVAGDFNSTPFSFIYKQFNLKLSDSFVSKGKGLGRTYNGVFPAYRIDYVFYKKDEFKINEYSSPALDFSDHYPVLGRFSLK